MPMPTEMATVLLAEDDPNDAFLLQHAFVKATLSHRLIHVQDGQQAIDYLVVAGVAHPVPDLLLLDLKMPRVDGFEVLDFLQQKPALKQMPVVVLSSSDHEQDIQQARARGAADFFRKPGDPAELLRIVQSLHERWLQKPSSPARAAEDRDVRVAA